MHSIAVNKKKTGHEFEEDWGGAYRRVWKEETEERNVIVKL